MNNENTPDLSKEKIQLGIDSIEEFSNNIIEFCKNHKFSHSINSKLGEGNLVKGECIYKTGFEAIEDYISEVDLPGFSEEYILYVGQRFEFVPEDSFKSKYNIEVGYLRQLENYLKKNIKTYTNSSLLYSVQKEHFCKYIKIHHKENNINFTIITYGPEIYLCLNNKWLFYYYGGKYETNPQIDTNSITPELYFQKFEALREKIRKDIANSQKPENKSKELADLLSGIEFD